MVDQEEELALAQYLLLLLVLQAAVLEDKVIMGALHKPQVAQLEAEEAALAVQEVRLLEVTLEVREVQALALQFQDLLSIMPEAEAAQALAAVEQELSAEEMAVSLEDPQQRPAQLIRAAEAEGDIIQLVQPAALVL